MAEFVVGGAVPIASVAYVRRDFEDDCFHLLAAANWVLLLGPRQHGKSSALVRLAIRLQEDGIATVRVDFQAFSQDGATYEDVCRWFATQVARAFGVQPREPAAGDREDIVAWLECSVPSGEGALAILIDEAGAVPAGALTRFYGQLRALYNSRADAPQDVIASRVLFLFSSTGRRARSSPSPTTQSQCSAAVNQRETVASAPDARKEQD